MKVRVFAALIALAGIARADLIALYNFEGEVLTDSANAANVTASDFGYSGNGTLSFPAGNGSTDAYSANNWPTTATIDDYFRFSITPDSGYQFSLTDITFDSLRSGTGPTAFGVEYSLNGGSSWSLIESFSQGDVTTWRTADVADANVFGTPQTGTVDFRIYATTAEASTGTWRVDNVTVNGAITVVPEPTTASFMALAGVLVAYLRRRIR